MFEYDESKFCPPVNGCGEFPPRKPHYTEQEEQEHVKREMKNTIERLLKFEQQLKDDIHSLKHAIMSDTTLFKNTFAESHRLFIEEVKNEVNRFEQNIDNSIVALTAALDEWKTETIADIEAKVAKISADLTKDYTDFLAETQARYNEFISSVESALNTKGAELDERFAMHKTETETAWSAYKGTVENSLTRHVTEVTATLNGFNTTMITRLAEQDAIIREAKELVTQQIADQNASMNSKFTAQDTKIDEAVGYMKTNLENYVENEISEMVASGEFADSLADEISEAVDSRLNVMETRVDAVETKVTNATTTSNEAKAKANAVEASNTDMIARVATVEGAVDVIETEISSVKTRATTIEQKNASQDSEISALKASASKITPLSKRVSALESIDHDYADLEWKTATAYMENEYGFVFELPEDIEDGVYVFRNEGGSSPFSFIVPIYGKRGKSQNFHYYNADNSEHCKFYAEVNTYIMLERDSVFGVQWYDQNGDFANVHNIYVGDDLISIKYARMNRVVENKKELAWIEATSTEPGASAWNTYFGEGDYAIRLNHYNTYSYFTIHIDHANGEYTMPNYNYGSVAPCPLHGYSTENSGRTEFIAPVYGFNSNVNVTCLWFIDGTGESIAEHVFATGDTILYYAKL